MLCFPTPEGKRKPSDLFFSIKNRLLSQKSNPTDWTMSCYFTAKHVNRYTEFDFLGDSIMQLKWSAQHRLGDSQWRIQGESDSLPLSKRLLHSGKRENLRARSWEALWGRRGRTQRVWAVAQATLPGKGDAWRGPCRTSSVRGVLGCTTVWFSHGSTWSSHRNTTSSGRSAGCGLRPCGKCSLILISAFCINVMISAWRLILRVCLLGCQRPDIWPNSPDVTVKVFVTWHSPLTP